MFRKISLITLIIFLFNLASPVIAFAQFEEVAETDSNEEVVQEQVGEEEQEVIGEVIPDEEPETTVEDEEEEETTTDEEDESDEDQTEEEQSDEEQPQEEELPEEPVAEELPMWITHEDGSYKTTEAVSLEKVYTIEAFGNLTVTFTKLPELTGKLYISQIDVPNIIEDATVVGNAYDITTDMTDGTFEYSLELPKPTNIDNSVLSVKYSENGTDFNTIKLAEFNDLSVIIPNLDHFTTFVVVRNPTPPPLSHLEMIIDNDNDVGFDDPEFDIVVGTLPGTWATSTSVGGYYGTDYLANNTAGDEVRWVFAVTDPGFYEVYGWWTQHANRSVAVPYTITHELGSDVVNINQQINGGDWFPLGDPTTNPQGLYSFQPGVVYTVTMQSPGTGFVVADAVRIRSTEAPEEVWVDDDWVGSSDGDILGTDLYYGYNGFDSIQEAIDAVEVDGLVSVAEGSYEEQLDIQKDITVSGAGSITTTIVSPPVLVSMFQTSGGTVDNYPIVYFSNVTNAVLENFTIDGAGRGNVNYRFMGIAFRNAGGTIQNTVITDIREAPIASVDPDHGVGIYNFNDDGVVRSTFIDNNQILNYQKNAIVISGDVNATITNNTIVGLGSTNLVVQNGIQLGFGATGTITGNSVQGNQYSGSSSAIGILLVNISPNTLVSYNNVFNNDIGIFNYEFLPLGASSPIISHHNTLSSNTYNALDDRIDSQWDDGVEGNSWDDYQGVDRDGDGVGDTQLPYSIINISGNPSTVDRYPLTTNFITTPNIISPANGAYGNSTDIPLIDWDDTAGTYPGFVYQLQGFSDPAYTNMIWNPGWQALSEITTSGLSDGIYYLRVRAEDNNGNRSLWSNGPAAPFSIIIDNLPPVTDDPLTLPESDSYWNLPIPVQGTTIDNFGVDHVNLYYQVAGGGGPWTLIDTIVAAGTPITFNWAYAWDPTGGPGEGIYDLRAVGVDTANNVESSGYAYNVTFDITAPPAPTGITLYRGHDPATWIEIGCGGFTNDTNITLGWNANPPSDPIDFYWVGINGDPLYTQVNDPDTTYALDMTTEAPPYQVIAVDMTGNPSTSSVSCDVTLDQEPPVVVITNPADGDLLSGTVDIRGTLTDVNPQSYSIELVGEFITSTTPITSFTDQTIYSLDTTLYTDDSYTFNFTGVDEAGNSTQDSITFIIDNTAPSTVISSPTDDSYWNSPIPIEGTSTDVNGTAELQLYYSPTGAGSWTPIITLSNGSGSAVYNWSHDWTPPADGVYDIRAISVDILGNTETGVDVINVTYDTIAPTSTVSIAGHLEDNGFQDDNLGWHGFGWYEYYEQVNLEIDTGDPVSDFLHYQIIPGPTSCPLQGDPSYTRVSNNTEISSEVNVLGDGIYTLCFYAEDLSGNLEPTFNGRTLRVDDTDPAFTIDGTNATGSNVGGVYFTSLDTFTVTITATDNLAGVAEARFELFGDHNCITTPLGSFVDIINPPQLNATRDLTVSSLSVGNYCMTIEVLDDSQNHSEIQTVLFTVDMATPTSTQYIGGHLGNHGPSEFQIGTFGWHGNGWYEYYVFINLRIEGIGINNTTPDFIMYQILNGDISTCPNHSNPGYASIQHNTNIANEVIGDGEYTLCYYAQDFAGNQEDPIHRQLLHVDNTDPTFSIGNVTENDVSGVYHYNNTNNPFTVTISVNDNLAGYTQAQYILFEADANHDCTTNYINSFVDNLLPPVLSTFRNLEIDPLSDGNYCLNIEILDDAQNHSSMQTVQFTIDTTFPVVNITNPNNGDIVSGDITLEGTIDEINLNQYTLRLYPVSDPLNPVWSDTDSNLTVFYDLDTRTLADGEYSLELYAIDHASNSATESINFRIDNTKPFVDPIPLDVTADEGTEIFVGIPAHDDVSVSQLCYTIVELDGGQYECKTGSGTNHTWTLDLTELFTELYVDNTYTLKYYVLDSSDPANQSDSDPDTQGDQPYVLSITVENVAPQVLLQAEDAKILEGATAKFVASFSDPSYVEKLAKTPDDAPWTIIVRYGDGSSPITWKSFDPPGPIDIPDHVYTKAGVYTVTLKVIENTVGGGDGEWGKDTVKITVLNNVANISISADPSTTVQEGTTVTLSADASGGNGPFNYLWSGACSGDAQTSFVPSWAGDHTCTVFVTDSDGDISENSITISVFAQIQPQNPSEGDDSDKDGDNDNEEKKDKKDKEENDVLGSQTCKNKERVSGYVFVDDNRNSVLDEEEKGMIDQQVQIYYGSNGENTLITSVFTNEDGFWTTELCPGEYTVSLNGALIPENAELEWGDLIVISVEEGSEVTDINFPMVLHKSFFDNFDIVWCVIPLILLMLIAVVSYLVDRMKGKKSEKPE